MIEVTNNARSFFGESDTPIYIYGAGNPGQWVSEYMERCHMEYEGFIDKAAGAEDCFTRGKRIISPDRFAKIGKNRIRVIVAIGKPQEALVELHWCSREMNILCLYPVYKDFLFGKREGYDINQLLSYFRNKLFYAEMPTILSNDCNTGFIYKALGELAKSPTVNTAIAPKHFLKICKNPHEYLEQDIVFDHWTVFFGKRCPVGKLGDVEVMFAHSDKPEEAVRKWNKLKSWINWKNMVYVLSDQYATVPYQIAKEFSELPVKHLLILNNSLCTDVIGGGTACKQKSNSVCGQRN